ncbi:MAG TPA: hypothetical protein ENG87_04950 [Candidatus Pacearchaeota archaeon]|nr:GMP synthase [glutamine-hydrolyzing] [archaeon BMS3Abin17]HDK42705.1 hypothetical protein [Candidatus Pacearchaeota archaeon]HDZ60771.1 hypothetical protein [Candidatus Pacearchaeota archaeon]
MKNPIVLLIDMCKEDLHSLEFVRPIEEILIKEGRKYFVKKCSEIDDASLKKCSCVIISGTSLMDEDYLNYKDRFLFLKNFKKPVLGICAGMQIIAMIFSGKLAKSQEIGPQRIFFKRKFLGLEGDINVYSLHNYSVKNIKSFEVFAESEKSIQAFKHRDREIYGVMFHPESRNKKLIANFLK